MVNRPRVLCRLQVLSPSSTTSELGLVGAHCVIGHAWGRAVLLLPPTHCTSMHLRWRSVVFVAVGPLVRSHTGPWAAVVSCMRA